MQTFLERINSLTTELIKIENDLNKLNTEFNIDGLDEIQKLNELIHQTTHEVASEIGFNRNKIFYLAKFIDFRNQYKMFSIEDLEQIIDSENLSAELKNQLFNGKSKEAKILLLKEIDTLKKTWFQEFENNSFRKIKSKYL